MIYKKIIFPSEKHVPRLRFEKALTFYLPILSVKTLISGTVVPHRNALPISKDCSAYSRNTGVLDVIL